MKTTVPNKKMNIEPQWHLIDARGKVLGKLSSEIAKLLIGKNKAIYTPNINVGDKVVVINAAEVEVSGNKLEQKIYHRYTGYPGGIRSETLGKLMKRRPTEALKRSVKGMLPTNKLRNQRMKNLYVYAGTEHPHMGQISEK